MNLWRYSSNLYSNYPQQSIQSCAVQPSLPCSSIFFHPPPYSECNETFPDYRLADDAQLLIRYLAIVSHLTIVKILYCNLQHEGPFPTQDNSWLRHFCFNGHLYGPLAKAQRIFPTKEIETQWIRGVGRVISAVHYHGNGLLLSEHQLFLSAVFFFGFSVWHGCRFLALALHRQTTRIRTLSPNSGDHWSCRHYNDQMFCIFLFLWVPRIVSLCARMSSDNAQTRNPTLKSTASVQSATSLEIVQRVGSLIW